MKTKTLDLKTLTVGVLTLAVALAFVPFVPTAHAATFSIYSDVNVDVVGVYNKALGVPSFVDLSLTPMAAVRAQEPKPYPTGYVSEDPEVTNSVWDNGVTWDFEVLAPSADWIWETERAEGPASYGLLDPLYDADASKYGRVVVFERTFDIGGVPTLGDLHLTADNAYEVWVNGTFVTRSATAKLAGWETSNLHEANVGTSGWQTVGSVDIEPYLAGGENTLTILAGNEYFFTDDGNAPVPALQSNPYKQYNPGAMIFALDVEYAEPLEVTKTVETSYDRDWDWTITKSADESNLLLADGQAYEVSYEVELGAISEKTNAEVSGTITITNPEGNPDATVESVDDVLNVAGAATVECEETLPFVLAAGATLNCTYSMASDGTDTLNTATVVTSGDVPGGQDTADVVWGEPDSEIDECVLVSDDNFNGPQGVEVCQDDLDKTIEYSVTFGTSDADGEEVVLLCGESDHLNTASYVAVDDDNDTGETNQDDWTVHFNVDCTIGCTLTQGYWKTHNESFEGGAPVDNTWQLLGDFDEDLNLSEYEGEQLFDDGTWFQAFWTPTKGRVWYQLAHQWMAAYLNHLNGAATPDEVDTALAAAETWLYGNDPDAKLKGLGAENPKSWASILGSYNEGLIGPGHCDEQNPEI
ncbi:MAG: hypothetical protein A3G58_01355 [Candidatus Colwellbacteria bacterium RIFCSPLOWO2_12_FULL_46_17]|uniref:DUF11 domain-containing protein n=1 Tax=Candidatus Colwellbacteria bacterium RIFCSPLOWO2_12_FULL_46_17 TaxID=1797695 RepID=A0A1G1ZEE3_9BACT|nr:MAG: hypothetical protein A3G58_01355 [Candidatus Colwellbacteria bacterium RIFCSPLOWO2_12_FULL_46_17]